MGLAMVWCAAPLPSPQGVSTPFPTHGLKPDNLKPVETGSDPVEQVRDTTAEAVAWYTAERHKRRFG